MIFHIVHIHVAFYFLHLWRRPFLFSTCGIYRKYPYIWSVYLIVCNFFLVSRFFSRFILASRYKFQTDSHLYWVDFIFISLRIRNNCVKNGCAVEMFWLPTISRDVVFHFACEIEKMSNVILKFISFIRWLKVSKKFRETYKTNYYTLDVIFCKNPNVNLIVENNKIKTR